MYDWTTGITSPHKEGKLGLLCIAREAGRDMHSLGTTVYTYIYIDPPTVALNYAAGLQTAQKFGCVARVDLRARGARISVNSLAGPTSCARA